MPRSAPSRGEWLRRRWLSLGRPAVLGGLGSAGDLGQGGELPLPGMVLLEQLAQVLNGDVGVDGGVVGPWYGLAQLFLVAQRSA